MPRARRGLPLANYSDALMYACASRPRLASSIRRAAKRRVACARAPFLDHCMWRGYIQSGGSVCRPRRPAEGSRSSCVVTYAEAWSHGERPEALPRAGVFVTHGLARVSSAPAAPRQLLRTPAALAAAWRMYGKKKVTSPCILFPSYLPAIPARNTEVRSHPK